MNEAFEIEVFRPGTFTPMAGPALTFTGDQLAEIAAAYDPAAAPAPAVVGHPATDTPAFGWARSFRFDAARERLVATVGDLEPAFADAVRAKRYRKVSMAFFRPAAPNNPKPGAWYPKHIGFLGGAAPAVSGLKPVELAGGPDEAVAFEAPLEADDELRSLARRLAEFIGASDRAAPTIIHWTSTDEGSRAVTTKTTDKAGDLDKREADLAARETEAQFAERERRLAERERALLERERRARHEEHVAFVEGLVGDGRLLPAMKDRTVAVLDALADEAVPEVSFAENGSTVRETALATLRQILAALPKGGVAFGEVDTGEAPAAGVSVAFVAPDGKHVDPDGLEHHARAMEYQRRHPNTSYLDAIAATAKK